MEVSLDAAPDPSTRWVFRPIDSEGGYALQSVDYATFLTGERHYSVSTTGSPVSPREQWEIYKVAIP